MKHTNAINNHTKACSAAEEYSRILSAAVINSSFRRMLLDDPNKAILNGFNGEQFHINKGEQIRLSGIRAASLADFAAQLTQT